VDAKKNPQIDPAVGQADNVALRGIETKTGQACILWPLAICQSQKVLHINTLAGSRGR